LNPRGRAMFDRFVGHAPEEAPHPTKSERTPMSKFIDGKICDALSGRTGVVRDPSTGEVVSEITQAGAEDVDRAVQAARNAYAE
jgi:Aldehyde dehydrogenase family